MLSHFARLSHILENVKNGDAVLEIIKLTTGSLLLYRILKCEKIGFGP